MHDVGARLGEQQRGKRPRDVMPEVHHQKAVKARARWPASCAARCPDPAIGVLPVVPLAQLTPRSLPCQYSALSLNFCSFPVAVRSSDGRSSTEVGHL